MRIYSITIRSTCCNGCGGGGGEEERINNRLI